MLAHRLGCCAMSENGPGYWDIGHAESLISSALSAQAAEVERLNAIADLYERQHAELYNALCMEDLAYTNLYELSKRHSEERYLLLPTTSAQSIADKLLPPDAKEVKPYE